ncbi:rCG23444, partial [Rattus norvegicus]
VPESASAKPFRAASRSQEVSCHSSRITEEGARFQKIKQGWV